MYNKLMGIIEFKIMEALKLIEELNLKPSNQEINEITLKIVEKNLIVREKLEELSNQLKTDDLKEILHSIVKILKEEGVFYHRNFYDSVQLYVSYITLFLRDKKGNKINELPKSYYEPICNALNELRKEKIIDGYLIGTNKTFTTYNCFEIYWLREGENE